MDNWGARFLRWSRRRRSGPLPVNDAHDRDASDTTEKMEKNVNNSNANIQHWSWRRRIGVLVVVGCAAFLCLQLVAVFEYNQAVESVLFKGEQSLMHDLFQRLSRGAGTYLEHTEHLLLFQHVPRTAGDSIRTHLFPNVTLNRCPWRVDNPQAPPRPVSLVRDYEREVREGTVIKGYFSTNDLEGLEAVRQVRRFTFLRDPIERVLSFLYFLQHRPAGFPLLKNHPERFLDDLWPQMAANRSLSRDLALRVHLNLESFVRNGMTYQLGDNLHLAHRRRGERRSEREVLERAKQALRDMAFVGFYEDLAADFWRLRQQLFPHSHINPLLPVAFYAGTLLGLPRLRVRKFASRFTDAQLAGIRARNQLDIELYEYARNLTNTSYRLYPSYAAFMWDNPLWVLAYLLAVAVLLSLPFLCLRALLSLACRHLRPSYCWLLADPALAKSKRPSEVV